MTNFELILQRGDQAKFPKLTDFKDFFERLDT